MLYLLRCLKKVFSIYVLNILSKTLMLSKGKGNLVFEKKQNKSLIFTKRKRVKS